MARDDDNLSRPEAQEIYRRLGALSDKIGELSSDIAVIAERQRTMDATVTQVEKETSGLNKLANRGMGIMIALALLGGAIGGFWERLLKLWTH